VAVIDAQTRRLTAEQRLASGTDLRNLFIEAEPGSGKTTVAAQRFGVLRYAAAPDARGVLAVSFTRSATAELRTRVLRTWGPSALLWPHRIATIDFLMRRLVTTLLAGGYIEWPGGHIQLDVIDDWRTVTPVTWHRTATRVGLVGRQVVVASSQVTAGRRRPSVAMVGVHVEDGRCTHDDVRGVLSDALETPELAEVVRSHLADSVRSLIVDEVFDANKLDLAIIDLAMQAGIEVTIIGDPWQALYGFRGARPEDVPELVARTHMLRLPLTASFRWATERQRRLARDLRNGIGVVLPDDEASAADVVLASRWAYLWDAGSEVLPVAFAPGHNDEGKAAATILLNQVTRNTFQLAAASLGESLRVLGIPNAGVVLELEPALGGVIETLQSSAPDAIRTTFTGLSDVLQVVTGRPLGSPVHDDLLRLGYLRERLQTSALTPGLTTHQAKGREWDCVGVRLDVDEALSLQAGLVASLESNRKIYVACTRARRETFAV
jgi:DNA helicase-2/ATP-dependent DNA helicase PcrA